MAAGAPAAPRAADRARPAGLPDRLLGKSRPRTAVFAVFCKESTETRISIAVPAAPSPALFHLLLQEICGRPSLRSAIAHPPPIAAINRTMACDYANFSDAVCRC